MSTPTRRRRETVLEAVFSLYNVPTYDNEVWHDIEELNYTLNKYRYVVLQPYRTSYDSAVWYEPTNHVIDTANTMARQEDELAPFAAYDLDTGQRMTLRLTMDIERVTPDFCDLVASVDPSDLVAFYSLSES